MATAERIVHPTSFIGHFVQLIATIGLRKVKVSDICLILAVFSRPRITRTLKDVVQGLDTTLEESFCYSWSHFNAFRSVSLDFQASSSL